MAIRGRSRRTKEHQIKRQKRKRKSHHDFYFGLAHSWLLNYCSQFVRRPRARSSRPILVLFTYTHTPSFSLSFSKAKCEIILEFCLHHHHLARPNTAIGIAKNQIANGRTNGKAKRKNSISMSNDAPVLLHFDNDAIMMWIGSIMRMKAKLFSRHCHLSAWKWIGFNYVVRWIMCSERAHEQTNNCARDQTYLANRNCTSRTATVMQRLLRQHQPLATVLQPKTETGCANRSHWKIK